MALSLNSLISAIDKREMQKLARQYLTTDLLPMSEIQKWLEQRWRPEATNLLLPGSITSDLLAKDAIAGGPYTAPTRAFVTAYQPNLSRPTMVNATLQISCTAAEGYINVFCDTLAAPVNLVAQPGLRNNNAANVLANHCVSFVVPAGHRYRFTTATIAGAPAYAIAAIEELTL